MSVINCCKDCEHRYVGCHAKCEQYITEKNAVIEERNELRKLNPYNSRAYSKDKIWSHTSFSGRSHKK